MFDGMNSSSGRRQGVGHTVEGEAFGDRSGVKSGEIPATLFAYCCLQDECCQGVVGAVGDLALNRKDFFVVYRVVCVGDSVEKSRCSESKKRATMALPPHCLKS